jgi:hypothetical protein
MNDDEKRGYSRGYNTKANHWPAHRPPIPPHPVVAALMNALLALRDECDSTIATFGPDDELSLRLGAQIDKADEALRMVSAWLREEAP